MASNPSTPTFPPASPSALATNPPQAPLDSDIPPLSLEILTDRADKAAALKLVADSVAQQRQQASFHLVFHPLPLSILAPVLATIYHYCWARNNRHDLGTALMLASGAIMAYLLAIRYLTSGYLRAAESLSWDFLTSPSGQEDVVIGTRFGADLIGALVLRLEGLASSSDSHNSNNNNSNNNNNHSNSGSSSGRKKPRSRQNSLKGGRGVIRAWTTRMRYRGKGVGGDMLREAVRVTRDRCGRDAPVGFAQEHANSVMVLSEMFNRPFRKREMRAARALEEVLAERAGRRK